MDNFPEIPDASSTQTGTNHVVNLKPTEEDREFQSSMEIEYEAPSDIPIPDMDQFNQMINNEPEPVKKESSEPFQRVFGINVNKEPGEEVNYKDAQPQQEAILGAVPKDLPPKYNIMDLFWLCYETERQPGEAQFVSISYNIDFGNLRINFYNVPEGAIQGNVVFNQSLDLIVAGTIYPSSCFQMMNTDKGNFTCIEQLINDTGEQWQKERPVCTISKDENIIKLTIHDPKKQKTTHYNFRGWQKKAFERAIEFTYNEGFRLRGQHILRKQ